MSPRLITFGGLSVTNGIVINGVANPRSRLAILAVLAAAGDRGTRRDKLGAMFWPDSDEERARNALRQALFTLRRDIGDNELVVGGVDLKLNTSVLSADVTEFDLAIQAHRYEEAVSLYAGPFLDGVFVREAPEFERWVDEQQRRLSAELGRALEALATAASARGDVVGAATWHSRLATHDPLSARVALRYMEALVAARDRERAVRHAALYADRVRSELDAEPDHDVLAYAERLRNDGGVERRPEAAPISERQSSVAPEIAVVPVTSRTAARIPRRLPGVRWASVLLTLPIAAAIVIGVRRVRHVTSPPVVAVAALENRTGDSSLATLGALATEGITRQLAQSGSIAIVDVSTTKGGASPAEAARGLGAEQLVNGRMYRRGDSLHVQMQVVDPRDGRIVHELDPVVVPAVNAYALLDVLRDRVGGAVAALTDTLYQPWSRAHSRPPTYAAFREFMTGLHAIVYDGPDSAAVHLTKAAQLDTNFVEAKVWLLEQITGSSIGGRLEFADSIEKAAVRQRDRLSDFDRASLDRVIAFREGRWDDVYTHARELVTIAPETQDAQVLLIHAAMATRRFSEVIAMAHRIDRTRGWLRDLPLVHTFDLQAHRLLGDYETAFAEWRRDWDSSPKTFDACRSGLQQLAPTGRERAVDSLLAVCQQLQDTPRTTASTLELIGLWYRVGGYPVLARRSFERALALRNEAATRDPRQRRFVGLTQCELEDWSAAHATLLVAADTAAVDDRVALAIASAHVGDSATVRETLAWLDHWPADGKAMGRDTMSRAFVLMALGSRDEALDLLRRSIAEGMAPPFQRWRNRFELVPLWGDPAFEALVQERK